MTMQRIAVTTDEAPAAIGPYSQAMRAGNMLFISGQLPIDPVTGEFVQGGIKSMTGQVIQNLRSILKAAGGDLDSVVKMTVFLADMNDFTAMNSVYEQLFEAPYPARSAFQVAALPKGAPVEMEAIAIIDG